MVLILKLGPPDYSLHRVLPLSTKHREFCVSINSKFPPKLFIPRVTSMPIMIGISTQFSKNSPSVSLFKSKKQVIDTAIPNYKFIYPKLLFKKGCKPCAHNKKA